MTLLTVSGLGVRIEDRDVVHDVTFELDAGDRLGVVGPSGAGKSMLTRALLGLTPLHAEVTGSMNLDGTVLDGLTDAGWSRLRGSRIGIVFQEPSLALNPTMRIGRQIGIPLRLHRGLDRHDRRGEATAWCERVGLPARSVDAYPHQLSGGQRQRAAIAVALAGEPDILVADEPTTALDTTVQREVLDLIHSLVADRGLALVLVTHDLAVAARMTDRLLVMYEGRVVESAPTPAILARPTHAITTAMIDTARRAERSLLGAPR